MNYLTRRALAAALDVSAALVTKHAKAGMPTGSVEAARAWRKANLRDHMTKGNRITDIASGTARAVARVHQLCPVAIAVLESGRFDLVETELRGALHAVPAAARESVTMDAVLWDRLTQHVRDGINALDAAGQSDKPVTEADIEALGDLGDFWFQVAAGERVWRDA